MMKPTPQLAFLRLGCCCENLEERTAPAADIWVGAVDSRSVEDSGSSGEVSANGTPTTAANLGAVQQQFPGTTGDGYAIAVLDSGVDYRHPALGGGLGANYKVVAGYNFVDPNAAGYTSSIPVGPNPMDENGHGTNVAGIAAAKNATYGGVAPDADIVALRVLDKNGSGTWSWVESALQYVIDHRTQYNIVAVNMSFGSGNYTGLTSEYNAIQTKLQTLWNAGVVNVASGGNNFYSNGSVAGLQFPAISQWVVSVGAVYDGSYGKKTWGSGAIDYVTYTDKIASFSQRSSQLDLLAPGALITSTGLAPNGAANYWTYAGSSQASPFVAAAALLVHQRLDQTGNGNLATADYIVNLLKSSGDSIVDNAPASEDNVGRTNLTFKRLDILAALQQINSSSYAPDVHEANNTKPAASDLGYLGASTSYSGLTFHTAVDRDWYSFVPKNSGTYRIKTPVASGTGKATFTFYDVSSNNPRTIVAEVVNGVATVEVSLRDKVRYFIEAKSSNTATGGYNLTIEDTAGSNAGGPPPSFSPDKYEVNNLKAAAKYIGSYGNGTLSDANLHTAADVDWYRFNSKTNGDQSIKVVGLNNASGTAKFTFYDLTKGKERTLTSTFVNGVATLTVNLRTGVNYFLEVKSANGNALGYKIDFGTGGSSSSASESLSDWDSALSDALSEDRSFV